LGLPGSATVLASGFDSTEGPAFDRFGNLFFVNWLSSQILKRTPDGAISEFFNTGGIPAGLAFHPDGSLWVADEGANIHGLLRISPDGTGEIIANTFEGAPLNGANDLVFDRNRTLYFSDPWGSNADNPIGGFYRRFDDGRMERLDSGLAFPNGVALNADESAVFLAETYRNRILRYPIDADGAVGPAEHWADTTLPSGPDGMAFDAVGRLLVAHYGGGSIDVFDPNGKQVDSISVPGANVTNLAFGGPELDRIVVTELETQSVYELNLSIKGQRLNDQPS
jgi:gluconolactonase